MKHLYAALLSLFTSVTLFSQDSMNCDLLFNWHDPDIPGSFIFDNAYNEIWGYAADGREYAIIGTTLGTHIFDVTDPEESEEIHFIEGAVSGGNIIHRDYHDYAGYLYCVADEGPSTVQIVDISGLPDEVNLVYDSMDLFQRSHNIFIDADNAVLYSCGGNNQLNLYDLSDPTNPTLIIDCSDSVDGWTQTAGYIHDIYVIDNVAYCNGADGLYIVDFSDPVNPVFLASLTDYPESGYNHSGWLHEDGQYYALADETHGTRIKLLDVSDMTDIQVTSFMGSEVNDLSIVHNLIFNDDILHVSHYYDGYYAFDISDPANPEVAAYYDTSTLPHANTYEGAWGVYPFLPSGNVLISDMQEGLFVLDPSLPTEITRIERNLSPVYPNPAAAGAELYLGDYANENAQVSIFDVTGKQVWVGRISENQSSLIIPKTLKPGVHHMRVATNDEVSSTKLLVQ